MKRNGITYGPPGCGKTLAMICAFPNDLFVGMDPSGVDCGSYIGHTPKYKIVKRVNEATALCAAAAGKAPRLIFDDATHLFTAEARLLLQENQGNKFKAFDSLLINVDTFLTAIKDFPGDVWLNMHVQSPKEATKKDDGSAAAIKGKYGQAGSRVLPGTVAMPGWTWPGEFPGYFSFVALVIECSEMRGPWPRAYKTGPDEVFITKDRYNITPPSGIAPMNLGELLRFRGEKVSRPAGLEWMEDSVELISNDIKPLLSGGDLLTKLQDHSKQLLTKTQNKLHVRWVIKDSIDRATLKTQHESILDNYLEKLQ